MKANLYGIMSQANQLPVPLPGDCRLQCCWTSMTHGSNCPEI